MTREERRERMARAIARSVAIEDGSLPEKLDMLERAMWPEYLPQADAALTAYESSLREEGMVCVPREPSETMIVNGFESIDFSKAARSCKEAAGFADTIYRAMIEAFEKGRDA